MTAIHERGPGTRKDGRRRDGRSADEVRVLDGAGPLAGLEGKAAAGRRGGEGGAGAADVPRAGADDAAVCVAAGGDLESAFAGERGAGRRGGGGAGCTGCWGSARAGFREVLDACGWTV